MNREEAKEILLLYRPGVSDANDPQIAEALVLAQREPDLARWLEAQCAWQEALRSKFRQIPVPTGFKEQIISEHAARERVRHWRPRMALAAAVALFLMLCLVVFWREHRPSEGTLAIYQRRMVGVALRGYSMDLVTNNAEQIRTYLAQHKAPADYVLPAALQNVAVTGCAVEGWQNAKVSMICFRTGQPLPPNQSSDLWLFVVDRSSLEDPPQVGQLLFFSDRRLATAVWGQGNKIYLLGTKGDEFTIRKFL